MMWVFSHWAVVRGNEVILCKPVAGY